MKNVINWSYERASWQWDVLCILIMCFIFLTPKTWFNKSKVSATSSSAAIIEAVDAR